MKKIISIIFITVILNSCGSVSNFFGGEDIDKDRIQGDRISILSLERNLSSDPQLRDNKVIIPSAIMNSSWSYPGGSIDNSLHNLVGPEFLRRSAKFNVAKGSSKNSFLLSSPVIVNGKIYALGSDSKVNAYNLKTKRRIWQKDMSIKKEQKKEGFGGGISYENGLIFVSNGFGNILALDANSGEEIWKINVRIPIRSAPIAFNNIVYVISHDNQVFALNAENGDVLWNHRGILESASVLSSNSVSIDGGLVFVPYSSGEIYAIRSLNGSVVWTDSLSRTGSSTSLSEINSITARPVTDNGRLISISHAGRMVSVDISWVSGDWVFVLSTNSELIGVSRNAGKIKWVTQLEQYINEEKREDAIRWSGPVMISDKLFVISSHGVAAFISPQTGEIIETNKIPGSFFIAPVIVDGVIYLLNDSGDLIIYN